MVRAYSEYKSFAIGLITIKTSKVLEKNFNRLSMFNHFVKKV